MKFSKKILQARDLIAAELLDNPNVTFVGVGYKVIDGVKTDIECVVVGVREKLLNVPPEQIIPSLVKHSTFSFPSVPTDVVESGAIVVFGRIRQRIDRTQRVRPSPCGVSIGHYLITAGTQGAVVYKDGKPVLLTNNHVAANSNDANIGDDILQPGPHDKGKRPDDVIGKLSAFVPIRFDGIEVPDKCPVGRTIASVLTLVCRLIGSQTQYRVFDKAIPNLVDAAIVEPLNYTDIDQRVLGADGYIDVVGLGELKVDTKVKKSGRTTGYTEGVVTATNVTVRVQYGPGKTAVLEDQVVIGPAGFGAGGDSGSAILTENNELAGLLFAGSKETTICNRIENVFELLNLSLVK